MRTLQFIGVGPMLAKPAQWQTNAVITHEEDGVKRHLLIDCGTDNRHALDEAGIAIKDIDAVYISHLHDDHSGGMGTLGVATYFNPTIDRLKLFCDYALMHHLWEDSMKGGSDTVEGKVATLTDYFDCKPVVKNSSFWWGCMEFTLVQTLHIVAGYQFMHSFGLMIAMANSSNFVPDKLQPFQDDPRRKIFYTSDTQFCPHQIQCFYDKADKIIHDCETNVGFKSKVHAHRDDLDGLDEKTKEKMHLVHYQPIAPMEEMQAWAKEHGFAGFVEKGQVFDLDAL